MAQQALSQQAMAAAIQQQALAWATLQQQPQNFQLLQGILSNLQSAGQPPAGLGGELSSGERKSSGVPSMDTFAATSSRSFSVPPGVGTGAGGSFPPIPAPTGGLLGGRGSLSLGSNSEADTFPCHWSTEPSTSTKLIQDTGLLLSVVPVSIN